MRARFRVLFSAVAPVFLFLELSTGSEAQPRYSYTLIAETNPFCLLPCEGGLPGLAINGRGVIAFIGCVGVEPSKRCGIFAGRGGSLTLMAGLEAFPGDQFVTSGPFGQLHVPSINDAGTVVFYGCHETQGCGLFTSNGGPATLIVGTGVAFDVVGGGGFVAPGIDADGEVAFRGCRRNGPCGVFATRRGRIDLVIPNGGALSMNANGVIAALVADGMGGAQIVTGRRNRTEVLADVFLVSSDFIVTVPAISPNGVAAYVSCVDCPELPVRRPVDLGHLHGDPGWPGDAVHRH